MTQVEDLAKYAVRASFADLSVQSRKQLPVHILDSLGCCIAALGAGPIEACRAQVSDFGGDGPCALIGGGNANPIFAAFWHTVLVRYVDFMDNFLAPTEPCHTADNFGVALTIAEYVGGSGRDLMLGVALGYTVKSRFVSSLVAEPYFDLRARVSAVKAESLLKSGSASASLSSSGSLKCC